MSKAQQLKSQTCWGTASIYFASAPQQEVRARMGIFILFASIIVITSSESSLIPAFGTQEVVCGVRVEQPLAQETDR